MGKFCKDRMLSIGELRGSAFVFVNSHIEILRAIQDGNYYGYLVGPHVWQKQMHRIESACEELERLFAEREADHSRQVKFTEAARHVWGRGTVRVYGPQCGHFWDLSATEMASLSKVLLPDGEEVRADAHN